MCVKIKVKLHAVYKDQASSLITIRYWFKNNWISVFDEERPGRSIEVTTEEMKIHDIV